MWRTFIFISYFSVRSLFKVLKRVKYFYCENTFKNNFIESIGLKREQYTTQISNYDNLCNIFNQIKTINNIINDLNIDCWLYISKNYLKLKNKYYFLEK